MNLGFKDQFCPIVEDGSKRHTIRAGSRFKAGDRADLYQRPRQKGMRLMFRAIVTRVETIEVWASGPFINVCLEGVVLTLDEQESFFWRDGFRATDKTSSRQAAAFWREQLAAGPFIGQVIHWDYESRFTEKPKPPPKAHRIAHLR